MVKRVIYGLNHKEYEDMLTRHMKNNGIEPAIVKTITYREALLSALPGAAADLLIFRDTIAGSVDVGKLLEQVRVDYPQMQIILISSKEPTDGFLTKCVSLGIYDIINSGNVGVDEITRHVLTPGTFRDVYQYYSFSADLTADKQKEQPHGGTSDEKRPKGLFAFLNGVQKTAQQSDASDAGRGKLAMQEDLPTKPEEIDQDLIRQTIEENAIRSAQQDMDRLIEKAVRERTEGLEAEIERLKGEISGDQCLIAQKESQISSLLEELHGAQMEKSALEREFALHRERSKRNLELCEAQLKQLRSDKNTPKWYAAQEEKWREKEAELEQAAKAAKERADALEAKTKEQELLIQRLQAELSAKPIEEVREAGAHSDVRVGYSHGADGDWYEAGEETVADYSAEAQVIPLIPEYAGRQGDARPRVCVVLGAKHGVGNSTVALNLAVSMARQGHKTILLELNDRFPLINEFFELTNVPVGLQAALKAAAAGDIHTVDSSIIRFRATRPENSALTKAYRKLPSGFHTLVYSNQDLVESQSGRRNLPEPGQIGRLLDLLKENQGYSRIVVDIQPDEPQTLQAITSCGVELDKLIMTLSHDTHSVSSAGVLIAALSKAGCDAVLGTTDFVLAKYNASAKLSPGRIARYLRVPAERFTRLSEDTLGYMDAAAAGVPYIEYGGRFAQEYETIRVKAELS